MPKVDKSKKIEIAVNRTMIDEINPIIPSDKIDFFPAEGERFELRSDGGKQMIAYRGNRTVNRPYS